MTGQAGDTCITIGPLMLQRFGLHCFVAAWQRGRFRPVAKLYFGWALRLGVWLGRDEDGDVEFAAGLPFAHFTVVITTWRGLSPQLRQWAEADDG